MAMNAVKNAISWLVIIFSEFLGIPPSNKVIWKQTVLIHVHKDASEK